MDNSQAQSAPLTIQPTDDKKLLVEIWCKIQDKQIHFDDLIMKSRSAVLSIVTVSVSGLIAYARSNQNLHFLDAFLLLLVPMIFWFVAFILDRYYYFPLLLGAVRSGHDMTRHLELAHVKIENVNKKLSNSVTLDHTYLIIYAFYFIPVIVLSIVLMIFATR